MNAKSEARRGDVWNQIDKDRRHSRLLLFVIVAAWSVVFLMVLVYGALVFIDVWEAWGIWSRGGAPSSYVIEQLFPLVIVVGIVSILVATLSTIGALVRSRTATLGEIQLRLAALESILRAQPDSNQDEIRE